MNKKITPALLFLTLGIGAVGVMHSNSVAVKAATGDTHKLAFGEMNHAIAINPNGVQSPTTLKANSDGETLTINATGAGYYLSNTIALEAGNTYLFSFDVMLPNNGGELNVALNGTWGPTLTSLYSEALTAGEYTHCAVVYEVPADKKSEQIIIQITKTPANGVFRFRNIFLEKQHDVTEGSPIGAILPSLPANTADKLYDYWTIDGEKIDESTIYSYSGDKLALPHYSERHSLTFQYREGETIPNVFANGDFESLDGWNVTSGANVSLQSEVAKEGKALKFEGTPKSYFQSNDCHVFSNSTYRLTFDVKVENASGIDFSTFVSGTYVSWKDYFTTRVTANCDWTTVTADFDVSSGSELVGTASVGFEFYSGAGTVYLDNAKLELVKNVRYYSPNDALGVLPDLPTKEGYHGSAWTIDGEALSADTAWKWDEDKVAEMTFAANQYTATFEADGKVVKTVPFTVEDTEINEPEIPAKEGYSAHWENYTLTASDITIRAVYEANQYSITIKDGESGNVLSTVQIKYGQKLGDVIQEWPSLQEKEGYEFDHWAMNGAPVTLDTVFEHEGDAEIYAVYEAIQYTASFEVDGKVIKTVTFTVEDTAIEEPEIPAKKGYTAHWESYTLTASDITVRAVYEPIQYSITIKDGESGNSLSTVQIKYGQKLSDVISEWPSLGEKEGYRFDHWAMNGAPVTLDTVFEHEGDAEIYAVYEAIQYTASFEVDGKVIKTVTFTVEDTAIEEPEIPAKEGYTAHWEEYTLKAGDITVKAVYEPIQYTATFVADGTVVATVSFTVEDTEINEPEIPAKKGYTAHWESYTLAADDITIKAIYEANQYSIAIKDGESGNVLSTVQIKYGQKLGDVIQEWPSLQEKEGYEFDHWAMNGAPVTLDTVFEYEGNAEIYAVYKKIEVEVPTSSEEPQTPTDSHSQTSSGATEQNQASEGLNAGAIAGIVIAACAVAAGLGVGLYFWLRPKKGKTK
ncbi:MAG: InlB B-repeat-containing protein [Erysipelotrichaceae bacterium]|nr:InlB B-repeat-containing protein [Erysipelotrichaceae bacterium]